jgi:hypothetical protein
MMTRTKAQNARLHWLFGQLNISGEHKQQLVYDYTQGRSTSSADLTAAEAQALIRALEKLLQPAPYTPSPGPSHREGNTSPGGGVKEGATPGGASWSPPGGHALNQLRRYLMSLAIQAGYYTHKQGRVVCDVPKLQAWIDHYGVVKKPLNELTRKELNQVVRQMEQYAGKEIRKS